MFKVRDLLIVCAVVLGVCGGIYRHEILIAARQHAAPVFWYVDAPEREAEMSRQHRAQLAELRAKLDEVSSAAIAQNAELAHMRELFSGAESVIRRMGEELTVERAATSALKDRYSRLCQRLLELGNDVPSVLAGE